MRLHRFGEDYLEAILILDQKRGYVRSSDMAEQMKVTKPSVTNATRLLKEGGFLTMGGTNGSSGQNWVGPLSHGSRSQIERARRNTQ